MVNLHLVYHFTVTLQSLEQKDVSTHGPSFLLSFAIIDLAWHIRTVIVHNNA